MQLLYIAILLKIRVINLNKKKETQIFLQKPKLLNTIPCSSQFYLRWNKC